MKHLQRLVRYGACALGLSILLAGCNDRVPPAAGTPPPTQPAAIEGIATPSSVAVVTATNAD
jgi:hypothetical protein